jgi:phenylacetic acid degradation operon negative regulatory protein
MAELKILPKDKPNNTVKVLKALSTATLIAGVVVAPNIASLLSFRLSSTKTERARTLRAIREAKRRGWLTFRDTREGVEVALSESGKLKWQKINMSSPLQQDKWDKKWRLVIFDIPTTKRVAAHEFRLAIKKLGFQQFQRSVWICPYPCGPQIAYFRQTYGLKDYIRLFEVIAVDDEASLKEKFNL